MSPDSPWFYILVTSGAAVVSVVGRWVWIAVRDKFREWVREPVLQAKEKAEAAAVHAESLQETLGPKNGNPDLMTMVARILNNQESHQTQFDAITTSLTETRAEVLTLTHMVAELTGRVAALELTRPPFDEAG